MIEFSVLVFSDHCCHHDQLTSKFCPNKSVYCKPINGKLLYAAIISIYIIQVPLENQGDCVKQKLT